MNHILRIGHTIFHYIPPVIKRRKIYVPSTNSISVEKPSKSPEGDSSDINMHSTLSEQSLEVNPVSWTASPGKRTRKDFEEGSDKMSINSDDSMPQNVLIPNNGTVLLGDGSNIDEAIGSSSVLSSKGSEISDKSPSYQSDDLESEASIECEMQERVRIDAEVQEDFDREAEFELRRKDVERAKASGDWHSEEIYLFERLCLRGFEFLLPQSWKIDFPTLPLSLFADNIDTPTLLNTNFTSNSYGRYSTFYDLGNS